MSPCFLHKNRQPSRQPSIQPSSQPSVQPSIQPSRQPSSQPSKHSQLSITCAAGTYLSSSAGKCVSCPAGTYSSIASATSCTPCAGTTQSMIGATVCSATPMFGTINLFAGILQYTNRTATGDNGPATSANVGNPNSLAIDNIRQKLYIADSYNNQIRQVDLTTNVITTVLKLSTYSTSYSLGSVSGISVDGQGNLYFTAYASNQVCHSAFIKS